jgi:hypothetical protein
MVNVKAVDRVGRRTALNKLPIDTFWEHVVSPGGGCLRQQRKEMKRQQVGDGWIHSVLVGWWVPLSDHSCFRNRSTHFLAKFSILQMLKVTT